MFTLRGHLSAASRDRLTGEGVPRTTYSLLLSQSASEAGRTKDYSIGILQGKLPPDFFTRLEVPSEQLPVSVKMPYQMLEDGDCEVTISLATRGAKGRPERQAYWREELARLAGQWVRMDVELHRYSFMASGVQRKGARIVLQSVEPI